MGFMEKSTIVKKKLYLNSKRMTEKKYLFNLCFLIVNIMEKLNFKYLMKTLLLKGATWLCLKPKYF